MRYTWDPAKNRANIAKHRIDFRAAIRIFDGQVVERIDDRFDYDEERWLAIGLVDGFEFAVVYTEPGEHERRIISARKATPEERRYYWRQVSSL